MESLLPLFAPLGRPTVAALVAVHAGHGKSVLAVPVQQAILMSFHHTMAVERATITGKVASYQQADAIRVGDALSLIGMAATSGYHLVQRWRATGILLPAHTHQYLSATSVVALLLARALWPPRQRIHLPPLPSDEPRWWCWSTPPAQARTPCAVPLNPALPSDAQLTSPWTGCSWADARIQYVEEVRHD